MGTGLELKEHGLGRAVGGIADAGFEDALRLIGRGGDFVAVAVRGEDAVIHPEGVELHTLHLRAEDLAINGDGHLRGQRGGGGVDVGQPDFILGVLRDGHGHLTRRIQRQGKGGFRHHVLTRVNGQRVFPGDRRIERLHGLRGLRLRQREGAQTHQQQNQSKDLCAQAIHPNLISCSCCTPGLPRAQRRFHPVQKCRSPRFSGRNPARCASRRCRCGRPWSW